MKTDKARSQFIGKRDGLHWVGVRKDDSKNAPLAAMWVDPATGAFGPWPEKRAHEIREPSPLLMCSGQSILSELEHARDVQRRLLPPQAPLIPGHCCRGLCLPAGVVGGDYYDFLPMPHGKLAIVAGDISGKGIGAALLMASLQASVRALTLRPPHHLGPLMEDINRLVYELSAEEMHASLFYGQYDPSTKLLQYVNAGHHPPLLLRSWESDCDGVSRLEFGGLVLGADPNARYEQASCIAEPGDLLVAYTDGVIEALNPRGEQWGKHSFETLLGRCSHQAPEATINTVLRELNAFIGDAPQQDDITLAVVRLNRRCGA